MLNVRGTARAPVGVIAVGQLATGVVAVGQLARGGIVLGQLSFGLVCAGQVAVGVLWSAGIGIAATAGPGLVLGLFGRMSRRRLIAIVRRTPQDRVPVHRWRLAARVAGTAALAAGWWFGAGQVLATRLGGAIPVALGVLASVLPAELRSGQMRAG
jgi:hypothetical protein